MRCRSDDANGMLWTGAKHPPGGGVIFVSSALDALDSRNEQVDAPRDSGGVGSAYRHFSFVFRFFFVASFSAWCILSSISVRIVDLTFLCFFFCFSFFAMFLFFALLHFRCCYLLFRLRFFPWFRLVLFFSFI